MLNTDFIQSESVWLQNTSHVSVFRPPEPLSHWWRQKASGAEKKSGFRCELLRFRPTERLLIACSSTSQFRWCDKRIMTAPAACCTVDSLHFKKVLWKEDRSVLSALKGECVSWSIVSALWWRLCRPPAFTRLITCWTPTLVSSDSSPHAQSTQLLPSASWRQT